MRVRYVEMPCRIFTALLTYSGCDVTFIIVSQRFVNGYCVGILIVAIYVFFSNYIVGICFSVEFHDANFRRPVTFLGMQLRGSIHK